MDKYQRQLEILKQKIEDADAILVGAASGMSAACGYNHYYERTDEFVKWFSDFEKKYHYHNSFNGFYHEYRSHTKRFAFIARFVTCILSEEVGKTYIDIHKILEGKNYHIMTTNQDTQFNHLFDERKISAIQGDWRYMQCSHRCHDEVYECADLMKQLNDAIDVNLDLPYEMLPRCPKCGSLMEPWVRSFVFLEGKRYTNEYVKIRKFLDANKDKKVLFLELGVGKMTPMFIQEPFQQLTYQLPNAFYININPRDAYVPYFIANKGLAIKEDIKKVFEDYLGENYE